MLFLIIPITAWIVCGAIKFGVNLIKHGYNAFKLIGHGGFPSNHTAIISSVLVALIFKHEWHIAGLAMAFLMITIFDATGLRRQVGYHAISINKLTGSDFRELTGHSMLEIFAGFCVGSAIAYVFELVGALG